MALRKGKHSNISDATRAKAKKWIAAQQAKRAGKKSESKAVAKSRPVKPAKKLEEKPIKKAPTKVDRVQERRSREPSKAMNNTVNPTPKAPTVNDSQKRAGREKRMYPKDVGTTSYKAAESRRKGWEKKGPFGDLLDLIKAGSRSGVHKSVSRKAKGGRIDGCATKGRTRGRFV